MSSQEHISHRSLLVGLSLITSRSIQSEMQLKEHLSRMEEVRAVACEVLECLHEPILITDRGGTILHANRMAAQLVKISPDILPGRQCREIIKSDAIETCLKKEMRSRGKAGLFGYRDDETPLSLRAEPIHNRHAEFVGGVIIFEEDKRKWNLKPNETHPAPFTFENVIGDCAGMKKAIELAAIFAGSDTPILLLGETGTGKELFAQAIHNLGPRKDKRFIPVNCAAIPDSLVESELFGYRKGAFTGAAREGKKGKFEMADGGTLFLDEIDSMPLELQAKLLRAVDDGEMAWRLKKHVLPQVQKTWSESDVDYA